MGCTDNEVRGERIAGDNIQQWLNEINKPIHYYVLENLDNLIQTILSNNESKTKNLKIEVDLFK